MEEGKKTDKSLAADPHKEKYPIEFYKRSRHHHAIINEDSETKISVGITHSPKRGKHKNIPLEVNPDSSDPRKSYIQDYPTKDRLELYENSRKAMKIDESDYTKLERVGKKKPQDMSKKK